MNFSFSFSFPYSFTSFQHGDRNTVRPYADMHLPCKFLLNWYQPALSYENQHFCKEFKGQLLAEILVTELASLVNEGVCGISLK